jgi:hypothetical protein
MENRIMATGGGMPFFILDSITPAPLPRSAR